MLESNIKNILNNVKIKEKCLIDGDPLAGYRLGKKNIALVQQYTLLLYAE